MEQQRILTIINDLGNRIILLVPLILCLMSANLEASQFNYVFPPNISLRFADDATTEQNRLKLSATIESLLGNLTNLEIFFDSSKDLKIMSNTRTLKNLAPENLRKVKILAIKTGATPDELGTWIKMGVRYLPDYPQILEAVNNTSQYPDRFERQKLLDILAKNSVSGARHLEVTRYFPQKAGN